MKSHEFDSVADLWRFYVPAYKSQSFRPFFVRASTEGLSEFAKRIRGISAKRSGNRIGNYVNPDEIRRVRAKIQGGDGSTEGHLARRRKARDFSIRFGVSKTGHGYSGERGDFCLVAAVYSSRTLTLFYRSIELIGGFAFDLVLIDHVIKELGVKVDFIEIWSPKAFIFALKGNSNEKLFPKLRKILPRSGPKAGPLTSDGNYDG